MKSPHEKALGKEYKKGTTRGDLIKHKRTNLKLKIGDSKEECNICSKTTKHTHFK